MKKTENDAAKRDSEHLIRQARLLADSIDGLSQDSLRYRERWLPQFLWKKYPVELPGRGEDVYLIRHPRTKTTAEAWSLSVTLNDGTLILVNPLRHPGAARYLTPPGRDGIEKGYISRALRFRADWERDNRLTIRENREIAELPATAFLYQWTMSALGENPGYAEPASPLTRVLGLVFALAKYLFVGVFVAFVLDEASRITPLKPGKTETLPSRDRVDR